MLNILYEDPNYIGFDKPAGMPTSRGDQPGSLVELVGESHPELFAFAGYKAEEGGLLYRLDNETQGLVLFAKNREAFERFVNDDSLEKVYEAEVEDFDSLPASGVIAYPLVHKSSKRMAALIPGKKVSGGGKPIFCETRFEKAADRVKCFIKKGARHQIRAHLASIGHPILGDDIYNPTASGALKLRCVGIQSGFLVVHMEDKSKVSE